jgi:hypothetical protein
MWGEIDFVRTDVFTPALTGLLPDKPVRSGDRWIASTAAVKELTDLEGIDEGDLECKLDEVGRINNRRQARVTVVGTVKGTNEDGPNRQRLEGFYYFDLESNHLSYLYLKGTHMLLDKTGKEQGRIDGRFTLTRTRTETARDLTDEGLKGLALEPNADNTRLLYDNPDLGVRFLHPRRWRVTAVRGQQVAIDGPDKGGLLLTLDALKNVPTAAEFLRESEAYLKKQGGKVLRTEQPRQVGTTPGVDQFAIEVEMGGQKAVMDYYVVRQRTGGATIAARVPAASTGTLRKDVEEIARSVSITKEPGTR